MTSPQFIQPGEHIQRIQTGYSEDFTDQHGRRFCAQFDIRNMRPKEEMRPVGFTPPWLPPQRFIKWERPGGFHFRWDYVTMANELAGDSDQFYKEVTDFMLEHMKEQEIPEIGDPVPRMILRTIGKPPLSPAVPLACEIGDPWMLGTPGAPVNQLLKDILEQSASANGRRALDEIKERMARLTGAAAIPTRAPEVDPASKRVKTIGDVDPSNLPKLTYAEFLSHCMGQGMKMSEAALAWQRHKDALKEAAA